MSSKRTIFLIAGPTASGKSQIALQEAERNNSIIINTDSMQVYHGLSILTASPNIEDIKRAVHLLYGHVSPKADYSTGHWVRDVRVVLKKYENSSLIFVGGTGLYFRALLEGIAEIPAIDEEIRIKWREALINEGSEILYKKLYSLDETTASRIKQTDGQRIIRALEVFEKTGKSISWWQQQKPEPLIATDTVQKILLIPPRDILYQRINNRFDRMVEMGALDEVQNLLQFNLSSSSPIMKAIGVLEFTRVIEGKISMDEAIIKAKTLTRHYAKRQMTWFRNQFDESWVVNNKDPA